ncbi:hypothetical protein LCGC14_0356020 [marine sediment metagenome]|uniref:Uncharacterized protein n=1 Tax=marine sediment metagenome TaxID=412755 RepID=A0A0F9T9I0_9ZZZZ
MSEKIKTTMTEFQIIVFRLRHHEHFGRSTEEAAAILETSPSSIRNALSAVRRTSPQLFPILSRKDWTIWRWWTEHKRTMKQIVKIMDLSYKTVQTKLLRTRKKLGLTGVDREHEHPHLRYEDIEHNIGNPDWGIKQIF